MFSKLNTTPGTVQLGEHPPPYHIRDTAKMVTSTFVNLRARYYIRANAATREQEATTGLVLCKRIQPSADQSDCETLPVLQR